MRTLLFSTPEDAIRLRSQMNINTADSKTSPDKTVKENTFPEMQVMRLSTLLTTLL